LDLQEKVAEALRRYLLPERIRLRNDAGIYGNVVSKQFRRMPALDRQMLIDKALNDAPVKFTKAQRRRVSAIAALTPAEYAVLGLDE
jgi:hypothetical protein